MTKDPNERENVCELIASPVGIQFVQRMWTEETARGIYITFAELRGGKLIGITDDCVVVYKSYEDYLDADGTEEVLGLDI